MSKFKKGDTVKVIRLEEYASKVDIGDIGVVIGIDFNDDYFPVKVKINDEDNYGFKENELEIINEENIKEINNWKQLKEYILLEKNKTENSDDILQWTFGQLLNKMDELEEE